MEKFSTSYLEHIHNINNAFLYPNPMEFGTSSESCLQWTRLPQFHQHPSNISKSGIAIKHVLSSSVKYRDCLTIGVFVTRDLRGCYKGRPCGVHTVSMSRLYWLVTRCSTRSHGWLGMPRRYKRMLFRFGVVKNECTVSRWTARAGLGHSHMLGHLYPLGH